MKLKNHCSRLKTSQNLSLKIQVKSVPEDSLLHQYGIYTGIAIDDSYCN